MNSYPTNSDDVIDSRDVIEAIDELSGGHYDTAVLSAEALAGSRDSEYLLALVTLAEQAGDYAEDWQYGATFIRDSYFEDYARELAEDIGAVSSGAEWPNYCIDWEWAARELQTDYTSIDFDGVTYWVR